MVWEEITAPVQALYPVFHEQAPRSSKPLVEWCGHPSRAVDQWGGKNPLSMARNGHSMQRVRARCTLVEPVSRGRRDDLTVEHRKAHHAIIAPVRNE